VLLGPGQVLDAESIRYFAITCRDLLRSVDKLVVVVGAAGAHQFIDAARQFNASDGECDDLGIEITSAVSRTVLISLKNYVARTYPNVARSLQEVDVGLRAADLVVVSAIPGSASSSDSVACIVAEHIAAELLVIVKAKTDWLEAISTRQLDQRVPRKVKIADIVKLVNKYTERAGHRPLLDSTALRILQRNHFFTLIARPKSLVGLGGFIERESGFDALQIVGELHQSRSSQIRRLTRDCVSLIELAEARLKLAEKNEKSQIVIDSVHTALKLAQIYSLAAKPIVRVAAYWQFLCTPEVDKGIRLFQENANRCGLGLLAVQEIIQIVGNACSGITSHRLEALIVRDANSLVGCDKDGVKFRSKDYEDGFYLKATDMLLKSGTLRPKSTRRIVKPKPK
jgi:uridylate kinase